MSKKHYIAIAQALQNCEPKDRDDCDYNAKHWQWRMCVVAIRACLAADNPSLKMMYSVKLAD